MESKLLAEEEKCPNSTGIRAVTVLLEHDEIAGFQMWIKDFFKKKNFSYISKDCSMSCHMVYLARLFLA